MEDTQLEPEFHAPYAAWQANQNPKTTGAMLKAVHPIVQTAVRTYVGPNASPTIQSKAKLLAIEGLGRYDPSRAKLKTHLLSHMQGLRRFAAKENQVIGIPERVGLDLHHLRMKTDELTDILGRPPSTPELADHIGISPKRIAYVRSAQPGLSEGITRQGTGEEAGASSGPAVQDPMASSHVLQFIYPDLHPTDQLILEHTLGLHGQPKLNKKALATKLRLSPGAISQRAAKIQEKIDLASDSWPGGVG